MWEIISVISSALAEAKSALKLQTLLSEFLSEEQLARFSNAKGTLNKAKSIANWANPSQIAKLLKVAPKYKIQELIDSSNDPIFRKTMKKVIGFNENKYNQEIEETNRVDNKWINLSSSWVKKGMYKTTDKSRMTGNLTVLIRSDGNPKWYGPYTYPMVPLEVWLMMTEAKGKNGSGAGTTFWKYWLRKWLPSKIRAHIKSKFGRGKQSDRATRYDAKEIKQAEALVRKLETGWFRRKEARNLKGISGVAHLKNNRAYAKHVRKQIKENNSFVMYQEKKWVRKQVYEGNIVYKAGKVKEQVAHVKHNITMSPKARLKTYTRKKIKTIG